MANGAGAAAAGATVVVIGMTAPHWVIAQPVLHAVAQPVWQAEATTQPVRQPVLHDVPQPVLQAVQLLQ